MILAIWQPQGVSTNKISKRIGEKHGVKATHTGTLDPMAEGVVVVLTHEDRFKKYEWAGWKKTYEFEIAFGLSTDSYDAMGMIQSRKTPQFTKTELKKVLSSFKGAYKQKVPIYSAIKIKGKKLFEYAKSGLSVENLPTKEGEIYSINLIEFRTEKAAAVVKNILKRLKNIRGDFRQEEIIKQWEDFQKNLKKDETFQIAKIKATTSKGLYIRSLSQDITGKLGEVGFVYSLVRTRNGKYEKEDCATLFRSTKNFYKFLEEDKK